jgi:hypothetical protein
MAALQKNTERHLNAKLELLHERIGAALDYARTVINCRLLPNLALERVLQLDFPDIAYRLTSCWVAV